MNLRSDQSPLQTELPIELSEALPAPWWAGIVHEETEGNQDTGFWGA